MRDAVRAALEEALRVDPLSPLRPRLLARLAIELYYASPATLREQVSERALKAGRRTGGRALLEALGARHVALWSPDHTEERLAIAEELVAAAMASGIARRSSRASTGASPISSSSAISQRCARRSPSTSSWPPSCASPRYYWYGPLWRASLALLAGRLDEAKRISGEGERIGAAARDENAALLFETQRNAINGALGRADPARHREHALARRALACERGVGRGARNALVRRRRPRGSPAPPERGVAGLTRPRSTHSGST